MQSGGTVTVAALGRPFSLGMLYDCRKDMLVAGMTLWDDDDLKKHVRERNQPFSDFEILASDSMQDKSSALNVEASLQASFLSGLVEVQGSAKYLNNTKTSGNHARVTVKYTATTNIAELSMEHLGNVKYQNVLRKGLATHVVTAILYGAQAFLVFDSEVSEDDKLQDIQGKLKVTIKKIPSVSIKGDGSLDITDEEKKKVEQFSCKFHGDFFLDNNPTTFQEAVKLYLKLPSFLKPEKTGTEVKQSAIPVKVWMLPLTSLDSSASKLVRQISLGLVQEAHQALEDLSNLAIRVSDALKIETVQEFPQIAEKLKDFSEMCSEFKLGFQQSLAEKLPLIRGGGEEEGKLAGILKKRHSSPFNSKSLNQWMDSKEKEIYTLMLFTKKLVNTKIVPSQSGLYKETLSTDEVLCFVFTSLGNDEPLLSDLSNYLKGTKPDDSHVVEKEQWYTSKKVVDEISDNLKYFSDFAKVSNGNKKLLAVGLRDDKHEGSTIYYYKDGFLVNDNCKLLKKSDTL